MWTRPLEPAAGSALDPLIEEVSWAAWRVNAAASSDAAVDVSAVLLRRMRVLAEVMWQPGRTCLLSQATKTADGLRIEFAVGCLGQRGCSQAELRGAGLSVLSLLTSVSDLPMTFEAVDPREVLRKPAQEALDFALIRQQVLQIEPASGPSIDVLTRFNPMPNPWLAILKLVALCDEPLTVRATALPTSLDVADRMRLATAAAQLEELRPATDAHGGAGQREGEALRVWRALSTINDLRESLASPLFVAEIAVSSATALPSSLLRAVACAFTSESDVIYRARHVAVASQPLLLGGFDIVQRPAGLPGALDQGLPLFGGVGPRDLRDLVTLTELPVGLPAPDAEGLPATNSRLVRPRPVPEALRTGTPIGRSPSGDPVHLPAGSQSRHGLYIGSTGCGKSTRLVAAALDALRTGQPIVYIDPHGTAVQRLAAFMDSESMPGRVHILGLDGPPSVRWSPIDALPAPDDESQKLSAAMSKTGMFVQAVRSTLPRDYTGPRFDQHARAIALLAAAHGATLREALSWYGDPQLLARKLSHPRLPDAARSTLSRVHHNGSDATSMIDWVLSKFAGISEGRLGELLAPAGRGLNGRALVGRGESLLVDLSSLPAQDAGLFGHLVLSDILEAAMTLRGSEGVTIFVDEAQRFPVPGLIRLLTEGRKFAASVHLATQSLATLEPNLADAALSAATLFAFRQSPDSAGRLAPVLGVPARDLLHLPDLTAIVKVGSHPATSVVLAAYEPLPDDNGADREFVHIVTANDDPAPAEDDFDEGLGAPSEPLLTAWQAFAATHPDSTEEN